MAFHEVTFPNDAGYGTSGGPGYNTGVVQTASGVESRVIRWETALHKFDITYDTKDQTAVSKLKAFYMARMGSAHGFRFTDPADNSTGADGVGPPTMTDVLIGVGNGTTTQFQLKKFYVSDSYTTTRIITKPQSSPTAVLVSLNGVLQTSGYTVNYTTGVITFTSAPGVGVLVKVGFYFDVPVRFGDEVDGLLNVSIDDYSNRSVKSLTLVEIRDGIIQSDDFMYGGSFEQAISADVEVAYGTGRLQVIQPLAGGLFARLPDPTNIPTGYLIFMIQNASGSNTLGVKNNAGATLATLATNAGAEAYLSVDGGGAKVWYLR